MEISLILEPKKIQITSIVDALERVEFFINGSSMALFDRFDYALQIIVACFEEFGIPPENEYYRNYEREVVNRMQIGNVKHIRNYGKSPMTKNDIIDRFQKEREHQSHAFNYKPTIGEELLMIRTYLDFAKKNWVHAHKGDNGPALWNLFIAGTCIIRCIQNYKSQ